MDSFDDLLANSRRALEENPFEDPFAKRSNSPDPWASFGQSSQQEQHDDVFASQHNAFADDSYGSNAFSSSLSHNLDRSDSATSTVPDDIPSGETKFPQSSGFRESTSTDEEATTTPGGEVVDASSSVKSIHSVHSSSVSQPREPEAQGSPSPQVEFSPVASIARPPSPPPTIHASAPLHSPRLPSPPPSATHSEKVYSPLEKSPIAGSLERPFASLALGGEFVGGWQEQQAPPTFATQPPPTFTTQDSRNSVSSEADTDKSSEADTPAVSESKVCARRQ
jgi:sorting nexin-1/2